jgi:hypothetical protein
MMKKWVLLLLLIFLFVPLVSQAEEPDSAEEHPPDIAGHLWPNASVINNYGSCFYCHGQAGNTAGRSTEVTVPGVSMVPLRVVLVLTSVQV